MDSRGEVTCVFLSVGVCEIDDHANFVGMGGLTMFVLDLCFSSLGFERQGQGARSRRRRRTSRQRSSILFPGSGVRSGTRSIFGG